MMMRWMSDTLSKRLLVLMWLALVGSHLLAFAAVDWVLVTRDGAPDVPAHPLPTFPSLPPTPGMPDTEPPHRRATGSLEPGQPQARPESGAPALPWDALLLDYGIRFAVIAAAAWFGSRWLARPIQRLVDASTTLGGAVATGAMLPVVDEHSGTVEVREAARVFNTMGRQLQQQFQARGLMVAAISHDLRTPLTRLRIRLESMGADAELQRRSIDDIRELDGLIAGVLEAFRPDAPHVEEPQRTDICALVQSLTDDLIEQGQSVVFDGAAAVTNAQPDALRRAVGNLLANAVRYGDGADVQVAISDGGIRITVKDTGPGIAPAQLEAVFQPFYRLESSRNRHTGGTGLGLYIARDLVQRQGGQLTLANRATGGLCAEITLPRR
jgi:protein-histidine pros-kinase